MKSMTSDSTIKTPYTAFQLSLTLTTQITRSMINLPSHKVCLLLAAFGTLFASCSPDSLAPAEYVQYTQNAKNGLHVSMVADSFTYDLQYEPASYYVLKKVNPYDFEASELDTIIAEAQELEHFNLRLGHQVESEYLRIGQTDPDGYFERLRFYSFDVQKHLFLIQSTDTLPCLGVQFDRTYGMTPFINLSLTFENRKDEKIDEQKLVYFDPLRNNTIVPFEITQMHTIPKLKL
jgi:hypothetical protein